MDPVLRPMFLRRCKVMNQWISDFFGVVCGHKWNLWFQSIHVCFASAVPMPKYGQRWGDGRTATLGAKRRVGLEANGNRTCTSSCPCLQESLGVLGLHKCDFDTPVTVTSLSWLAFPSQRRSSQSSDSIGFFLPNWQYWKTFVWIIPSSFLLTLQCWLAMLLCFHYSHIPCILTVGTMWFMLFHKVTIQEVIIRLVPWGLCLQR